MSKQTVRTRFPPSPTGDLHVGGARVALFNYLFARHHGGEFILRLEDTDQERSSEASAQSILQGMSWLGLSYDEGPFYQSQRFDRYKEVIDQLLSEGKAYRCYCTRDRLEALRQRQQQQKQKPRYDGCCRDQVTMASGQHPYVVRFKTPKEGVVVIDDLIYGQIVVKNDELDDLIIARSDGTPTYHLTVVVDDYDMQITHVIRGEDHINNTPKQIHLFHALGAPLPTFAHLPMILGADGKRLSKRHGAESVMYYHEHGYLPHALLNYLVRLGWASGDKEIFSLDEMIRLFSLDGVTRSPGTFDLQKLDWLNQHYMKSDDVNSLSQVFLEQLTECGLDATSLEMSLVIDVMELQRSRVKTMVEMAQSSLYFFTTPDQYDDKAKKHLKALLLAPLQACEAAFACVDDWTSEAVNKVMSDIAERFDMKLGKLAPAVRGAVTGGTVSPPLGVTLVLIGQEAVLSRLSSAVAWIESQEN